MSAARQGAPAAVSSNGSSRNGGAPNGSEPEILLAREPSPPRVAVIGGGASGTLSAVHLLRRVDEGGVEVSLIDAGGEFGPGLAYSTNDPLHLLNVPAVRMGGISGRPEHFHEWLCERGAGDLGEEAFVPRGLFGAYLRELLAETEGSCTRRARLDRVTAEVTSLSVPTAPEQPLRLGLADGGAIEADQAVLALGPLGGGDPIDVPAELREAGTYVPDPWAPGALDQVRGDDSVLVIGSGLTMVDLVLSLCRKSGGPRIRVVSRHGLVPRRHRRDLTKIQRFPVPNEDGTLEPVMAAVVEQIGRVALSGGDWRDVFDSMRSSTPAIWRGLRTEEKRRFCESLQRVWDVHRFRMAPDVADRFEELTASGRVRVDARAILALEPRSHDVRVCLHTPGEKEPELVDVDRILNCTGAGANLEAQATPLLRDLLDAGVARPEPLGIGLDVAPDGALIDAAGNPSERIRVVGSLRKGVEWEAIGVTEIRDHAAAVAAALFATVERPLRVA